MKHKKIAAICVGLCCYGGMLSAAIPEPSVVLHGTIQIGARVIQAKDDVAVIARVGGVSSPVGRYQMGDRPSAGDNYVLQIRLESLADGSPRSGTAALIGETANLFVQEADGPEQPIGSVLLSQRGLIQPFNISSACVSAIVSSTPANCAIDARQPINGPTPAGWNSVALAFNCLLANPSPADFSISLDPAGAAPSISNVSTTGDVVTVTLSSPIPSGAWTCFTHVPSGTSKCLGFLPGDVNSNKATTPTDILDIIDNLNGVRIPPLVLHQCDLDRSNQCAPADIITEIDMLNGSGGFTAWNGRTLPNCPSAP